MSPYPSGAVSRRDRCRAARRGDGRDRRRASRATTTTAAAVARQPGADDHDDGDHARRPRPTTTTTLAPLPDAGRRRRPTRTPTCRSSRSARSTIPKIGLQHPIFEGVWLDVVDHGPGHWPGSAMPGRSATRCSPATGSRTRIRSSTSTCSRRATRSSSTCPTATYIYAVTGRIDREARPTCGSSTRRPNADHHAVRVSPEAQRGAAHRREGQARRFDPEGRTRSGSHHDERPVALVTGASSGSASSSRAHPRRARPRPRARRARPGRLEALAKELEGEARRTSARCSRPTSPMPTQLATVEARATAATSTCS